MNERELIGNYGIVFDAKPDSVPYNYRISYKVSQICVIIAKSSRGKSGCSLVKLHMISFALCSKDTMDKLLDFAETDLAPPPMVRFDPAVNRAVSFAVADSLIVQLRTGKYVLSDKGNKLVDEIEKDSTILTAEKSYLSLLAKKLTEAKIERLSEVWRSTYAED